MADKHRITISEGEETKVYEVSTESLASGLSDAIAKEASEHDKIELLLDSNGVTTSIVIEKSGGGNGR
jgi:hypothetical protein